MPCATQNTDVIMILLELGMKSMTLEITPPFSSSCPTQ